MNPVNERRNFIKSMAIVGAAQLLPKNGFAEIFDGSDEPNLTNWSGNIKFKPRRFVGPRTIDEIQRTVVNAQKVKVIGSRHSFNNIADSKDVLITMENFGGQISINHSEMTAEIPAAMTLRTANKILAEKGYAFASLGEIDEQTISGLIATSTHGTGLKWGNISDSVRGVTLVSGNGEYIKFESGDYLAAAKTHLGLLGVIVYVTMQIVPAHHLERVHKVMPIDEALDLSFISSNEHTNIYYFPFADITFVKYSNLTTRKDTCRISRDISEIFKENLTLDFSLRAASIIPSTIPKVMKGLASFVGSGVDSGPSYEMMVSSRMMRYHEMELAMDTQYLRSAFNDIRQAIKELAHSKDGQFFANMPISIRTIKGCSDNMLSPTLGKDTVFFSFASHVSFEGYDKYFKKMENLLTEKYGARPHWGKHFYLNPLSKYEKAERFFQIQSELDPQRKFINPFILRLL